MVPQEGFEPSTLTFVASRSNPLSYWGKKGNRTIFQVRSNINF